MGWGSLREEEGGGLDFGERRQEQRSCHLGGNLLIWPRFLELEKVGLFLTEKVVVSRTNNDSDKHKLCHLTLRVAVAPEFSKKITKKKKHLLGKNHNPITGPWALFLFS